MGVFTYESVVITVIPPAKMFKACILDGNGEAGSIKKVTFGEGSQFKYMKQKVEAIDKENFVYIYSVVEGDALMNKLEKITYETKLEASPDGGSICRTTSIIIPLVTLSSRRMESRLAKTRLWEYLRPLKRTSWKILTPIENIPTLRLHPLHAMNIKQLPSFF
ncbi:hypothetical protein GOBAR_DD08421 [Gossypium barbadense]|nr:hypothetical protein GOBAR_DD08421 [Gossypium barbadense]